MTDRSLKVQNHRENKDFIPAMPHSNEVDPETLIGHYLLAGLDGRLDDQRDIGIQLIQRGQMTEALHDALMLQSAERGPLARPIIAGPDS